MDYSTSSSKSFSKVSWQLAITTCVLRILTVVLLSVTFTILNDQVLGTRYFHADEPDKKLKFRDDAGYQYMVAAIFLGIGYSVVQTMLAIYLMIRRNKDANKFLLFEFYGDKAISYLLVSAAIGGFITTDDKRGFFGNDTSKYTDSALNKSNISATLLLLGFICSAISSVISSYKLAMRSSSTD